MSAPWRSAWHDALYGAGGFYRREHPHAHFSTATSPGLVDVLAEAVVALVRAEGLTGVVDVAAGGGELASAVCALAPDLRLTCIEVRPRPAGLPARVRWVRSPGGSALPDDLGPLRDVLVIAHEWLDNVPCVVAERAGIQAGDGRGPGPLREVWVDDDGTESPGPPADATDLAWAERWWPDADRVEVGRARDEAWAALVSRVERGLVVAVDYGHTAATRPEGGTLTGYRAGETVAPVPDGMCDLTAHVAVDSLRHDRIVSQRDLLAELGLTGTAPDRRVAREAPAAYLQAVARRSAVSALRDPAGLGGFWWVLVRVR
ncbi:MAG: SAM-dependent methyltransferase [Dermatophilaceae bacterium]